MEAQDLCEHILGTLVLAFLESFPGTLKEKALTEGLCKSLDFLVAFKHPNIVEFSALLHDFCLEDLGKSLDLNWLLHINQVAHRFEVECFAFAKLLDLLLIEQRSIMPLLVVVLKDVFHNFLHQNAIVAFGCHSTVRL